MQLAQVLELGSHITPSCSRAIFFIFKGNIFRNLWETGSEPLLVTMNTPRHVLMSQNMISNVGHKLGHSAATFDMCAAWVMHVAACRNFMCYNIVREDHRESPKHPKTCEMDVFHVLNS